MGRALAFQDAQCHLPSQQYCKAKPCLPGCKAPPPPSQQYNKGGALAPQDAQHHHPPPNQYCMGRAPAFQDAQHHLPSNNIAWVEPLPSRMHSTTPPPLTNCKGGPLPFQDEQHHLPLLSILQGRSPRLPGCTAPPSSLQQYCNGGESLSSQACTEPTPRTTILEGRSPCLSQGCTSLPPPTKQYCMVGALPPRNGQHHLLPPTILQGRSPSPRECTAPPPPPNNIAWARALAFQNARQHHLPPPTILQGGALASQDPARTTSLSQQYCKGEPLPPGCTAPPLPTIFAWVEPFAFQHAQHHLPLPQHIARAEPLPPRHAQHSGFGF
ncbi:hypothetical protein LSTR_LSTR008210 [Laodelphax striatellus]|uniref:Uncharacterized protein n=1 Tax=Laodelphax striatellus TaxID=195883 RepID=A0A482WJ82_LAOST|nr:hypothetical protein LSTR_LSTR008210 [Laodelphax striatellus]